MTICREGKQRVGSDIAGAPYNRRVRIVHGSFGALDIRKGNIRRIWTDGVFVQINLFGFGSVVPEDGVDQNGAGTIVTRDAAACVLGGVLGDRAVLKL